MFVSLSEVEDHTSNSMLLYVKNNKLNKNKHLETSVFMFKKAVTKRSIPHITKLLHTDAPFLKF